MSNIVNLHSRQANTTISTDQKTNAASISAAEVAFAVLIPILLISVLMTIFVFCRRRRRRRTRQMERALPDLPQGHMTLTQRADTSFRSLRASFATARLAWQNRFVSSTAAAANRGQDTEITPHIRSTGRRQRPRRTDSGSSVKTLPEYNELGPDEVMLWKAIDEVGEITVADLEEGATDSRQDRQRLSNRGGEGVARQSSLSTVADLFRRISLRRTTGQEVQSESNEMSEVMEREAERIPEEDAPQYSNLYPTIPPQIQVTVDESADQRPQRLTASNSGRSIVRSLFRRGGAPTATQDTLLSRVDTHTNDTSTDLRLVPTRSNDLSLYRPSTSSSRRMLGNLLINASSASLLSQSGLDSSDSRSTLSRPHHQRNISAPISASARRLQFAPPTAGFSERQMQFLNSVESLGRYGIPLASEMEEVPPSFEQLARSQERDALPTTHSAPILTPAELYREESPSFPLTMTVPVTNSEEITSHTTDVPNTVA